MFHKSADSISGIGMPDSVSWSLGSRVGAFRLLQKLGEGGMGIVYQAEQENPVRRSVALKIIKPGMDSSQVIARFEAERQALAMMDHQNIAKVLDAGATIHGQPYFAMELVKGIPITEYCDTHKLTIRERLELFLPVCHAIQHAHQKGIIHRDIKPTNVLVTSNESRPLPKVIDFGIAKATQQRLTERTLFTGIGQILGTPQYMSPEQAELNQLDIDTRSDIYSLGALLYELLTGSTPIPKEELRALGQEEFLRSIRETDPQMPSTRLSSSDALPSISAVRRTEPAQLSKLIRGELDWIVMKALEKDRTRRYETANGFAMDIQRFLADETVEACPPSARYRLGKFVRRHRKSLLATMAVAIALIGATIVSLFFGFQASILYGLANKRLEEVEREKALKETALADAKVARNQAEESRDLYQKTAYASDMQLATEILSSTYDVQRISEILDRNGPQSGKPELRGWEWRYLWQFCQNEADDWWFKEFQVGQVKQSPDGAWLGIRTDSSDLHLARLDPGHIQRDKKDFRTVSNVGSRPVFEFAPDSKSVAIAHDDSQISIVELPGLRRRDFLKPDGSGRIRKLVFIADGSILATQFEDHFAVFDVARGEQIGRLETKFAKRHGQGDLCSSRDGMQLAVGDAEGGIRIYDASDLRAGDMKHKSEFVVSPTNHVHALEFSPDGKTLACGSAYGDFSIRLFDAVTNEPLQELKRHAGYIIDLEFLPDGRLCSASSDGQIRIWDTHAGTTERVLRGHRKRIGKLATVGSGKQVRLLSCGFDGGILEWNVDRQHRNRSELAHQEVRFGFGREVANFPYPAITRDEKHVAYLNGGGSVTMVEVADVRRQKTLGKLLPLNTSVVALPEGNLLATGTVLGNVRIFNVDEGKLVKEFKAHDVMAFCSGALKKRRILSTFCLPKGRNSNGDVAEVAFKHWSIDDWTVSDQFSLKQLPPMRSVAYSNDEQLAVTTAVDKLSNKVDVWKLPELEHLYQLDYTRCEASDFSPTERDLLVIPTNSGHVMFFDVGKRQELAKIKAHQDVCMSVAFFPDGKRIATGGNGTDLVRIWDVSTKRQLLNLPGTGARTIVQVSEQGNVIVARSADGVVTIWQAPSWDEIGETENSKFSL